MTAIQKVVNTDTDALREVKRWAFSGTEDCYDEFCILLGLAQVQAAAKLRLDTLNSRTDFIPARIVVLSVLYYLLYLILSTSLIS